MSNSRKEEVEREKREKDRWLPNDAPWPFYSRNLFSSSSSDDDLTPPSHALSQRLAPINRSRPTAHFRLYQTSTLFCLLSFLFFLFDGHGSYAQLTGGDRPQGSIHHHTHNMRMHLWGVLIFFFPFFFLIPLLLFFFRVCLPVTRWEVGGSDPVLAGKYLFFCLFCCLEQKKKKEVDSEPYIWVGRRMMLLEWRESFYRCENEEKVMGASPGGNGKQVGWLIRWGTGIDVSCLLCSLVSFFNVEECLSRLKLTCPPN